MEEGITLLLSKDLDDLTVRRVREAVAALEGVQEVLPLHAGSIHPGVLTTWISLAGQAPSAVETTIIGRIFDRMKELGVYGALLELPNGGRLPLESASLDEIRRVVTQSQAEEAVWLEEPAGM